MTGGFTLARTPVLTPDGLVTAFWERWLTVVGRMISTGAGAVTYGTRDARLALPVNETPDGAVFVEPEGVTYQMRGGSWVYVSGRYARAQADLALLALGAGDAGLLVDVTDYAHTLRWTGAAWESGEGAWTGGALAFFDAAPGAGWKAIDGNGDDGQPIGVAHPVRILKADGTTRSITALAALAGYLKGGAFTGALVAGAGSVTLAGATGSGQASLGASNTNAAIATVAGATQLATGLHSHVDAGHTHTLSGAISLTGDPVDHMEALAYIRK